MADSVDPESRRSMFARVTDKVVGGGVPPRTVDDAVARVANAIEAAPVSGAAGGGAARLVAAIAARSTPDLGSRVRRDLEREGVVIEEMGIGTVGQHTVVTLRVPAAARPALQRLAERSRYSLSFLHAPDAHPDLP